MEAVPVKINDTGGRAVRAALEEIALARNAADPTHRWSVVDIEGDAGVGWPSTSRDVEPRDDAAKEAA